jgi:signal transduction histidine kinase/ligand-binding sensor domain-containing protein
MLSIRKATIDGHCTGFLIMLGSAFLAMQIGTIQVWGIQPPTGLSQYAHRQWRFGDAGLLGTPQSLTQSADGYIWVSTENGLFRFDGMQFRKWEPPAGESLPSSSTWYLLGARNGSIYVGTDLGLARITKGHVHVYPSNVRWPGPFLEDAQNDVWMGISGVQSVPESICKIGESNFKCLGTAVGFDCARGIANTTDAKGYFWIGGSKGICRWKPGEQPQSQLLPSVYKSSAPVRALAAGLDGLMWAGGPMQGEGTGLIHFEEGHWRSYVTSQIDGRKVSVSSLLANRDGSLWIGTSNEGILRLLHGHVEHFDAANGLSAHNVLSMYQDREGGVWVVTPMGIDYFRDYSVLSLSSDEGYLDARAVTVTADHRGTVFLGSRSLSVLRDGVLKHFVDQHGQPVTDVQFLFTDSNDKVWIGTRNHLLVLKDEKTVSEIRGFPLAGAPEISYITEDRNHDIWAAVEDVRTRASFLLQINNGEVSRRFDATEALAGQEINALASNSNGGLWVGGSAHGLFWFHQGRFQRIAAHAFDDRVENLMVEKSGALWLVTPHGFLRYASGRIEELKNIAGLPCDSGVNIQSDGAGSTWFYTHCGIAQVSDVELAKWWSKPSAPVKGQVFSALDGARPNLSNGNPAQTPDGRLWSASDYIFQIIDRKHLPFNPLPPPVEIESFEADGVEFQLDHNLFLPAGTRQIEIGYVGLSYSVPELVRFRYRLQGYDPKWANAGGRRHVFYNDLGPGRYTFHVIAANNSGVWNSIGAKITFTIAPAWYQILPFRLGALLLVVLMLALAYLHRLRSHTRALKLRFDTRLEERTRMARDLHDTLLQTIQGSKMVADAARSNVDDRVLTLRTLDRLSDWLDRASHEGRAALESLRTSNDETANIIQTLRRAASDCCVACGTIPTIATSGIVRDLHPIAQDEIYRIGYEAIRNACLHSNAGELRIEIGFHRTFWLEIYDNGKGISEETLNFGRPGHFGLTGMRERASQLGGKLEIASSPQHGTTISLRLPGHAVYKTTLAGFRAFFPGLFKPKGSVDKDIR